jgi:hypothetical protein
VRPHLNGLGRPVVVPDSARQRFALEFFTLFTLNFAPQLMANVIR